MSVGEGEAIPLPPPAAGGGVSLPPGVQQRLPEEEETEETKVTGKLTAKGKAKAKATAITDIEMDATEEARFETTMAASAKVVDPSGKFVNTQNAPMLLLPGSNATLFGGGKWFSSPSLVAFYEATVIVMGKLLREMEEDSAELTIKAMEGQWDNAKDIAQLRKKIAKLDKKMSILRATGYFMAAAGQAISAVGTAVSFAAAKVHYGRQAASAKSDQATANAALKTQKPGSAGHQQALQNQQAANTRVSNAQQQQAASIQVATQLSGSVGGIVSSLGQALGEFGTILYAVDKAVMEGNIEKLRVVMQQFQALIQAMIEERSSFRNWTDDLQQAMRKIMSETTQNQRLGQSGG